ncbi:globin domain-containing protein [Tellurirhabdus rosea]|uniref:globin domain-containing protein n=1 Tax=Tellurirhabdus rosea TaxID=2674997 RepID=UPI00224F40E4|nr:globin domain-containing protein [Tellurirhabdus rosea]
MTTEQISLVKQTFGLVAQLPAETVGSLFYARLFFIAPEVKPLFARTTTPEQSRKLLTMLGYVIARLDRLDDVLDEVAQLARRHVRYGVQDRHYTYVGEALLDTLETGLGTVWTDDVRDAWVACYTLLASAMLAATDEAVPVTR